MDDGNDDLERRLRNVLRSRRLDVDAAPDALNRIHAGVARRRQRRTAMSSAATLAIVGVVVAAVVVRPHERPAIGARISPSPTAATGSLTSPVTPPSLPSMSASDASNAPTTFNAVSVSAVSADHFWVLGYSMTKYADGASGGGATILSTTDGGAHFSKTGTIDVIVAQVPMSRPYGVPTVSDIRFGDATHGWAYGDALFETDDGGTTWTAITQVPGSVVDLATVGDSVWAISQTQTNGDAPTYTVYRARFSANAPTGAWSKVELPLTPNQPPNIAVQGDTAYLLASTGTSDRLIRLTADGKSADEPGPCTPDLPSKLSIGGRAGVLWATCTTGMMASIYVSSDAGATWRQVPTGGSNAIDVGAITASSAILADNVGDPLVLLHADGSRSKVDVPDSAASASFIGFTSTDIGYVIASANAGCALWRTTDGGLHWSTVNMHG